MSDTRDRLDLVFDGDGVSPKTTDARQLLASALAYLDAIAAVVGLAGEEQEASLRLTLEEIYPGSVGYACAAELPTWNKRVSTVRAISTQLDGYLRQPNTAPKQIRPRVQRVVEEARRLDPNISFVAKVGNETLSITEAAWAAEAPVVWSVETMRVRVVRVGGLEPRVQFESDSEPRPFSLRASHAMIMKARDHLYNDVDIEGRVTRATRAPYPILDGTITDIEPLDDSVDALEAWDAWYEAAGRPWQGVTDIEEELRGDD